MFAFSIFGLGPLMSLLAVIGIVILALILIIPTTLAGFYKKVPQGKVLIVSSPRGKVTVAFTGQFVWPVYNKAEVMDISLNTIEIDRRGNDGMICKDNIRADIKVTFYVRVGRDHEDVIQVAQSVGCTRASDRVALEELFNAKFSEALKTVGKQLDFVDLYTKREDFRKRILEVIGVDLNGYQLEDAAIDYLEQTPMSSLDPKNVLDAQGIRKITDLTAVENIRTNEFQNNEKKLITKQNVEAREAILELERQQADAEAKQGREIAVVRARETAETQKVQAEEKRKSELARIKTEEEVAISEENKQRQVAVAMKNRERVVAVENERVEKDRALEAISRERETELATIAKQKEVEKEKKEIADVIRERLAVERTMAEEEERIKQLRLVEEAKRIKESAIITAEGEAQELLVKDIKAAEAGEEAAKFRARERLLMADAQLEVADKEAQAKMRLAEGTQAEEAAIGLANVTVKNADADATEKVGMVEARVQLEKMQAEAKGVEAQGDAQAKVKEADAGATEKHGLAEAVVLREKGLSDATVVREKGTALAETIQLKLEAEAAGLEKKAEAMNALDDASRGHEEYRLRLENERAIELQTIEARKDVARSQSEIVAEALKTAKIDIVGGENLFFERLVNSVTLGKSVDGFFKGSHVASTAFKDYLDGTANLPEDLKKVLTNPSLSAKDLQNLTLSGVLGQLMLKSDEAGKSKLQNLLAQAKKLGVDKAEL